MGGSIGPTSPKQAPPVAPQRRGDHAENKPQARTSQQAPRAKARAGKYKSKEVGQRRRRTGGEAHQERRKGAKNKCRGGNATARKSREKQREGRRGRVAKTAKERKGTRGKRQSKYKRKRGKDSKMDGRVGRRKTIERGPSRYRDPEGGRRKPKCTGLATGENGKP